MKLLTKVQTFDGQLHENRDAAMRHLDRVYGEAICTLVANMITETDGKYTKLQEYIDGNLESFKHLIDIKQDMVLEDERDDD